MMVNNSWIKLPEPNQEEIAAYGKNIYTQENIFSYRNGIACFSFRVILMPKNITISGSLNNWSTMQSAMKLTDSGWIYCMKLPPGRYMYKYIIDGKWTPDPNNKLKEDDTYGSYNSIVFCYNYLFWLKGHADARTVVVCGSFNNWNEKN